MYLTTCSKMLKLLVCITLLIGSSYGITSRSLEEDAAKYLLPGNILPIHYNLSVLTHLEHFHLIPNGAYEFSGYVEILVEALEDQISEIILHSYDDMTILSANISANPPDELPRILNVGFYDNETNKQTLFTFPSLGQNQQYVISLNYTGKNTHDQTGFYRASYYVGLQRRWLLVTDFETSSARRGFPCFDEPVYKATFQLTVELNETLIEEGYAIHHNTEIESETISEGRQITTFKKTPLPISTYMVAFLISDFLASPNTTYFNSSYNGENGIKPFNTLGRPNYINSHRDLTSQIAGPALLNIMTKNTKVGYGYGKVEQVGLPDFGPGLTENWGLVTYREHYLFWDEENGTTSELHDVVGYIAHELSNQWFGDLVTPHWWSDLWLNEGFACFFKYHAADQIREPAMDTSSWGIMGSFMNYVVQYSAFYADGLSYARPLTFETYDKDTINDIFDNSISSSKGAAVIRMIMHILGEELFYEGLTVYLNSQKESIGTPEILFASWDKAINSLPENERPNLPGTAAESFRAWHIQAGYPLLTVTRQGADLTITQMHYLLNSNNTTNQWNIPLSYSSDLEYNFNDTSAMDFILETEKTKTITIKNGDASWFVLNNQVAGYYRINYDDKNWEALLNVIHNPDTLNQIHPFNRAQIVHDSSTIAHSKYHNLDYRIFLESLKSLRHDRSLVVWNVAYNEMTYILTYLEVFPETYSLLKKYFSWIVKPAFDELTMVAEDSDSHTRKLLRVVVAKLAFKLEFPEFKEQATEMFYTRSFHPDLRFLVLCHGVQEELYSWQILLEEALASDSPSRKDFLSALTCSTNDVSLQELMDIVLTSEVLGGVDKQDIIYAASEQGSTQARFALQVLSQIKLRRAENILIEIGRRLSEERDAVLMEELSEREATVIRLTQDWQEMKHLGISRFLKNFLKTKK